jgi:hypothetical protein
MAFVNISTTKINTVAAIRKPCLMPQVGLRNLLALPLFAMHIVILAYRVLMASTQNNIIIRLFVYQADNKDCLSMKLTMNIICISR